MNNLTFGEKLKQLREEKGLSKKRVADDLNIKYSTYAGYENQGKKPYMERIIAIAEYFNKPVEYLIGCQSKHPEEQNLKSFNDLFSLPKNTSEYYREIMNLIYVLYGYDITLDVVRQQYLIIKDDFRYAIPINELENALQVPFLALDVLMEKVFNNAVKTPIEDSATQIK